MAIPVIRADGASSGAGSPGLDRYLDAGEVVTLVDTEVLNSGATYLWTILDAPIGSAPVLSDPAAASPTFTAPGILTPGTVLIHCLVNGVDEATIRVAVALQNTGGRIPAFTERGEWNDGGDLLGWHEAMTDWMRAVDTALAVRSIELVEVIEPLAATSTVVFTGLDGDSDSSYHMRIRWTMPAPAAGRLQIRPNGLSSNQYGVWSVANGGAGLSVSSQTEMICAVCESQSMQYYTVDMTAASSMGARVAHFQGGSISGTAAATSNAISGYSTWDEQATNITSLTIAVIDAAGSPLFNQISTLSRFELYRIVGQ